jgi:soluble lytic murein transglycosylase-like protein
MSLRSDLTAIERRVDAIASDVPTVQQVASFARLVRPEAIARAIDAGARAAGLDPALVAAVATTESGGDPNARSAVGAQGLMQLMPATARSLGVADPFDPVQNVRAGATYLRTLIDRFGNLRSAIAAYNAGPGAVARFGGVPPYAETRVYVERVLDAYRANLRR